MNSQIKAKDGAFSPSRFAYLDIAKALGIITVVFAHINISGSVYQTFYSFHIPLFFILAGMTFKSEQRFGDFIYKKAKRLLIPYLTYSLITFAWFVLVEQKMPENTALTGQPLNVFFEIFLARGSLDLQHNPALWFIPCLFVAEIIYYGLCKCKKPIKITASILIGACGCIFTLDFMPEVFRQLPWQAGVSFVAIPFMLIGNEIINLFGLDGIEKAALKKKWLSIIALIILVASVIGLAKLNAGILRSSLIEKRLAAGETLEVIEADKDISPDKVHVSMGQKTLGNIGIYYLNALLGAAAVIILSVLLADLLKNRIALHKSWLVWLGERSYAIMAIHFPVKRRMVVIVGQACQAWFNPDISSRTYFTSTNLTASFAAFLLTMLFTIIITVSAEAFTENARLPGKVINKK